MNFSLVFFLRFFNLLFLNPWPLMASLSSTFGLFFFVSVFFGTPKYIMLGGGAFFLFTVLFFWFSEIMKESVLGAHKSFMNSMFKFGMIMFILSEICFFFSFFWAFFYNSMKPLNWKSSSQWPPFHSVDCWSVPFLKTLILLSSGVSLTWVHHNLIKMKGVFDYFIIHLGMGLTIFLGVSFEILQFEEYCVKFFSINSTMYGSSFYMLTGFHGFHVLMGLLILFICWMRFFFYQYKNWSHQKLLLGAWYWHFVDVVWLFLFIFVYSGYQTL